MFDPFKKKEGVVTNQEVSVMSKVNEIMKEPSDSNTRKLVCVGIYLDKDDQIKPFIPKITFSVFHGDQELIGDTETIGFAEIPVGKLPPQANASTGSNTDAKGKYMFYTAVDGKEVKIYYDSDDQYPKDAKAFYVKNGLLENSSSNKFTAIGMGSHSSREELLRKLLPGEKFLER